MPGRRSAIRKLSTGMGTFNLSEEIPSAMLTPVHAADVNGDGFADIIVGRSGGVEIRVSNP